MALNWFKRKLNKKSPAKSGGRRKRMAVSASIEPLDARVMLSVTALFSGGMLRITGDDQDNIITVSRDVAGTLRVNNGAIVIQGDPGANVTNTRQIMMVGGAANDKLSLDESNGVLPGAGLFGGDGNDSLTGGSGIDFADGGAGNDVIALGANDDTFQWNPGNGSDVVDGQAGVDTMVFNGADVAEKFELSDTGNGLPFHLARLTRDVGGVVMDLGGLETIELNAFGGADTITVNDQSVTDLFMLNIDLNGASLTGDGQRDAVIINGTELDDTGNVASFGSRIEANMSLFPAVNISGAEGANDTLTLNALGGNDEVNATGLDAGVMGLIVNGGGGDDLIFGSAGNDQITGGIGRDKVFMQGGDDTFTWSSGDGSDIVEGEDGTDTLNFNGDAAGENIELSANGSRTKLADDIGNVSLDVDGIEQVSIAPLGGVDNVTVDDLTGTAVENIKVKLGTDGQSDNITVNGSNGTDTIGVDGDLANGVTVTGFAAGLKIVGTIESADSLTINGNGGTDVIGIDLNASMITSVNGGAGRDTINILNTAPDGVVNVLPSTGDDTVNINTDASGTANVSFDVTQRIGALNIGSGGVATLASGGAKVLTVTSLNITGTGTLNLRDNNMIIDYAGLSPIANIQSLLKSGFNNGAWNGHGIISDLADDSKFALGFGQSADVATGGLFAGAIVDNTAVVVKFTLYGDADLDGTVGFSDLVRVAQSLNSASSNWTQGDFNYDAAVDFSDLVHLAQNYNATIAPTADLQGLQRQAAKSASTTSAQVVTSANPTRVKSTIRPDPRRLFR